MLWLSRPPYLRWAAAALLVLGGFIAELWPERTLDHPFLTVSAPAGFEVTSADVEWRQVPAGLLPAVELPLVTDRPFVAGEPLLPPTGDAAFVPEGWWALELPVPSGAVPGRQVRVVVSGGFDAPPLDAPGLVVGSGRADGFGPPPALVAVPAEYASAVAVAAAEGRATVLLGG